MDGLNPTEINLFVMSVLFLYLMMQIKSWEAHLTSVQAKIIWEI